MNDHPENVAKELDRLSNLLAPKGFIIVTLKLKLKSPKVHVFDEFNKVKNILQSKFENFRLRWLFGNSVCERTLFAQIK